MQSTLATTGRGQLRELIDELASAHVQIGEHGLQLGHGERRAEFGPNGFPSVARYVHQAFEQPVVFERLAVRYPIVERPELRGQNRVHQRRVAQHQHGLPELVYAEISVSVETPVQRVHGHGGGFAAEHGPGKVSQEQRRRCGVRNAQDRPEFVVVRAVRVRQQEQQQHRRCRVNGYQNRYRSGYRKYGLPESHGPAESKTALVTHRR